MADEETGLARLLEHIKEQRGFDFTGYKSASLARRIQRRMQTVGISDYEAYLNHLEFNPDEFTALFNTILINVTGFFRDPDAWTYMRERLIPPLLQRREGQTIRLWSAGCASGEEAYSLAMILADQLGLEEFRQRVKIYATDVDEEALIQARNATYTAQDLEALPPEFRETFVETRGSRFVFRKELRRAVIFGRNDLVQDAPISHVDILACRNTLMYFNAETQSQVLNRLHFALRSDGVLFLGRAEMLLSHAAYFRPLQLKQRFFQKMPTESRDRRLIVAPGQADNVRADRNFADLLGRVALMSSATAQLVLDGESRLVISNHRAMHLFGLSPRDAGRPFQDLEVSYRPLELRSHLEEAVQQRRAVWVREVEMVRGTSDPSFLDIQFVPLADDVGHHIGMTIIFTDVTQARQLRQELEFTNRQLETAYEELQSTNEELETTNEELQSTVEELETTNEELQSTNEELETMNEELQSMNDELQLSNDALRDGQEEVDRLNRFMSSLLSSMNSGVAVVDTDLRVLAWNSKAADLWGIRTDEAVGQHLLTLDIGLPLEGLRQTLVDHLASADGGAVQIELDAVNRRGRSLKVRVTVTGVRDNGEYPAAMLVMDVDDAAQV
jgi:two-component system, chemotaxis family, CheB/CheR fusion protein